MGLNVHMGQSAGRLQSLSQDTYHGVSCSLQRRHDWQHNHSPNFFSCHIACQTRTCSSGALTELAGVVQTKDLHVNAAMVFVVSW